MLLPYKLDLYCVITMQNFWRAKTARREFETLRFNRRDSAATKLVAIYRGYDMRVAYRRYIACRKIPSLGRRHDMSVAYRRDRAATKVAAFYGGYDMSVAYRRFSSSRVM